MPCARANTFSLPLPSEKKKPSASRHGKKTRPNFFILNGSVNSKHAHPHPPPPPSRHLSDICHFVLEKLQMPHGGAERLYKIPTVGLKNRVQMPHPGITPKLNFQLISCKYHIYGNSLITC